MAPPKGKGAAARSNPSAAPSAVSPKELEFLEPLDDGDVSDDASSHTPSSPDTEAELVRLRESLVAAHDLIATLQQQVQTLVAAAPPVKIPPGPVVPPAEQSKVNKPTEFTGKLSEYSTFISQCLLTFEMCPVAY